jgi:hypothetical protein
MTNTGDQPEGIMHVSLLTVPSLPTKAKKVWLAFQRFPPVEILAATCLTW